MRFFKSIRWQLELWHGLLLLAVICAFGFTAYQLEKTERLQSIDAELQRRLSVLVSTLRGSPRDDARKQRTGGGPAPRELPPQLDEKQREKLESSPEIRTLFSADSHFYYVIWMRDESPAAISANAPRNVPRPKERDALTRFRENLYREAAIYAAPVDCVLVGRTVAEVNAAIRFHALLLAGAGGVLLALGLAGGWWLASHALRPVREISKTAAQIANGDLSQRINTSQTGSELGELASLLNSTFARLETAFAQQARFTSDAAHELRTPLTVLLTQTQAALARERSASEYRDALLSSQATAQRMRRLIESMLELARLDAGQEPLRHVSCDLSVIATDCAELLRPLADARNITLHLDLTEARCAADPGRIAQVITNILKNAIDYNRDHGEVRLTTEQRDGAVSLEVTNTGAGIPPEHLPHIFERFYRADAARSDSSSRNGLGLAISKAIVEAHGGSIKVSSILGEGAKFIMILPKTAK